MAITVAVAVCGGGGGGGVARRRRGGQRFVAVLVWGARGIAGKHAATDFGQPFNEKQTRHIIYHALLGLIYLNSNFIMHRDIKAANILITDSGDAKLGAFRTIVVLFFNLP